MIINTGEKKFPEIGQVIVASWHMAAKCLRVESGFTVSWVRRAGLLLGRLQRMQWPMASDSNLGSSPTLSLQCCATVNKSSTLSELRLPPTWG